MTQQKDIYNRKPFSKRNHIDQYVQKGLREESRDKYENYYQVVRREAYLNIAKPGIYNTSFENIRKWMTDQLPASVQKSIIDIGCGVGHWSGLLAETYSESETIGVDLSYQMVKLAKDHWVEGKVLELDLSEVGFPPLTSHGYTFQNLDFIQADASDLPFKDQSCSIVISILSLDRLNDIHQVLKEINRVLDPGGLLLILTPFNYQSSKLWKSFFPLHKFIKSLDPLQWKPNCIEEGIDYCVPIDVAGNFIHYKCAGIKMTRL